MIYIVNGDESYLVKNKIDEIINSNKDAEIIKFDGNDSDFSCRNVADACRQVGLFSNKTLVLVKDAEFLITKVDEKESESLILYCQKPIYENTLVFYTYDNLFNSRLKTFKEVSANAKVITLNKLDKNEFFNYARNLINNSNLNINKDASNKLVNSSNYDLALLNSNIEILKLYPEQIDINVVNGLITFPDDEDIFNLINSLTNKNVSLSLKYANRLLKADESIIRMISVIASQLRFLYQVAFLSKSGKSSREIAVITQSKDFRISKALSTLNNISDVDILKLLSKLSDFDYKCKTQSDISDKLNLELLIVSLMA